MINEPKTNEHRFITHCQKDRSTENRSLLKKPKTREHTIYPEPTPEEARAQLPTRSSAL